MPFDFLTDEDRKILKEQIEYPLSQSGTAEYKLQRLMSNLDNWYQDCENLKGLEDLHNFVQKILKGMGPDNSSTDRPITGGEILDGVNKLYDERRRAIPAVDEVASKSQQQGVIFSSQSDIQQKTRDNEINNKFYQLLSAVEAQNIRKVEELLQDPDITAHAATHGENVLDMAARYPNPPGPLIFYTIFELDEFKDAYDQQNVDVQLTVKNAGNQEVSKMLDAYHNDEPILAPRSKVAQEVTQKAQNAPKYTMFEQRIAEAEAEARALEEAQQSSSPKYSKITPKKRR